METKKQNYDAALLQIKSLLEAESDAVACMANVSAVLHEKFGFWWTGFYRVVGDVLVLGPFQGPLACMRIAFGRGVCGTAWLQKRTIVVPDVHEFPGHIACSSISRSEIVVPVIRAGEVVAVIDIDSERVDNFDEIDADYLQSVARLIAEKF